MGFQPLGEAFRSESHGLPALNNLFGFVTLPDHSKPPSLRFRMRSILSIKLDHFLGGRSQVEVNLPLLLQQ